MPQKWTESCGSMWAEVGRVGGPRPDSRPVPLGDGDSSDFQKRIVEIRG